MTDFQTIKDRLFFFIEGQGISVRKFERMCGLSNGYVKGIRQSIQPDKLELIAEQFPMLSNGYVKGIRQSIQPDKLELIAEQFPMLSKSWLMTGEGEMLKGQAEAPEAGEKPAGGLDQVLEQYQQVLSEMLELRKNNADLTKEVGQIRELQKRLEEERGSLLEQNKKLTDIIERLTKEG